MPKIDVDTEVYGLLEDNVQGFERPNDVLRRMLGLDAEEPTDGGAGAATAQPLGNLGALIRAGLLQPGDALHFRQPRKDLDWDAEVGEGGTVITKNGEYQSPSRALSELVNGQINGWTSWVHVASGKTLGALRSDLRRG